VAGLNPDPAEPGYRHTIFRPRPGGSLTWAEASLETIFGLVGIRWELDGETLRTHLTVPSGTRATLISPPEYGEEYRCVPPGRHSFSFPKGDRAKETLLPGEAEKNQAGAEEQAIAG
jgi:alpha-L-rhamnosidase